MDEVWMDDWDQVIVLSQQTSIGMLCDRHLHQILETLQIHRAWYVYVQGFKNRKFSISNAEMQEFSSYLMSLGEFAK